MKKTFLLTVLILSIVLGTTAFAVTETPKEEISADIFWNNGNAITRNSTSFVAGTLPTSDTANYMARFTINDFSVGRSPRFKCYGTGYLDDNADNVDDDGIVYASAALENGESTNAVFKLTGNGDVLFSDTKFESSELTATGKHSIRFNYSSEVPEDGVISLFVLSNFDSSTNAPVDYRATLQDSGVGVFVSNGGAYIHNAITDEAVWFVPQGRLSADTWYTAEAIVEIISDGYIVQNAWIKDAAGEVVGNSGCYKVSAKKASEYESGAGIYDFNLLQLGTKNLGSGTVMLDDWKTYAVTDTLAKGTITFVQDSDKATRKNYKFETGVVLDASLINTDLVTVTCVSDPTLDMTGKYIVTCENTAIVVKMDESLPMDTKFKMEINADKMLSMTDGCVAFDYSSTLVTDSMSEEFTTPSISEIFVTSFSDSTPTPSSTITLSNGDVVEHEYMIVASLVRAGKYLETAATHGTLAARDAMTSAPTVASALSIPSFTTPTASGDKIMVMVWDNWKDMNSYRDTVTEITVP